MKTAIDMHSDRASRLAGLRRFAIAITVLNILGHTVFGFEQAPLQPLVALLTAYSMELLLESVSAWSQHRRPSFRGGFRSLVDFLLSAHITGLAIAMLTYANERLWPVILATAIAIGSKAVIRIPAGSSTRHVFNPSNLGITAIILLFPWVSIAPPYQFTENLGAAGDLILPGLIIFTGSLLNARLTHRLPLIGSWLAGFVVQALARGIFLGVPLTAALLPMTGVAFILYTFYMVTDPATTPSDSRAQVVFGAGLAAVYGILMVMHIVFGLFFALTIVCGIRAASIYVRALMARRAGKITLQAPAIREA